MSAQFRFPRFFVTTPAPCPYLAGRTERKVFTELSGAHAGELNEALGRIGFRRSQSVAYRPSCLDCQACVSVRVVAGQFEPNSTQRKLTRRNSDLVINACRPWTTEEQYDLLRRYLSARHPGGGMAEMDAFDFADMVEQTPVTTYIIEYREPSSADGKPGKLIGACLTDRQSDGLSMVYSFYDPESDRGGLGTLIILDHIERAKAARLPYVYLGYWVKGSARMQYKTKFRPIERLGPSGWRPLEVDDSEVGLPPMPGGLKFPKL